MRIALIGNEFPSQYTKYIKHLIHKILEQGIDLIIEEKFFKFLYEEINLNENIDTFNVIEETHNIDYLFSIGGDGTLLQAVSYVKNKNIPIMGINTGRLGFIASISTDQIDVAITDVLKGEYKIRNRTVLTLNTVNNLMNSLLIL